MPDASADFPWPTCAIPPLPPARGFESSATVDLWPRYEDIAQDGRVQLTTLMPGLGAVWRELDASDKVASFRARGVLPILSRILIVGETGPFGVSSPISFSGTWRLAREAGGERIFLDMWFEAHAPIGSALGPAPPRDAERVLVGRIYAEHVVTRPFAPPGERKVTRLDTPGLPTLPEDARRFEGAEGLVEGHALAPAGGEHLFGMMHTDSNQHVNSLVYPRLFEETVIRTATDQSLVPNPTALLARTVELRYRKPFFLGERAAISLAIGASPGDLRAAAVGAFTPSSGAPGTKPSCTVAMRFG